MNKKHLPHIIAVGTLVVFIVLGLACASSSDAVKNAASVDELTSLRDKIDWLKINAVSGSNYVLEVNANERVYGGFGGTVNLSYKDKSDITITLKGVGANRIIIPPNDCTFIIVGSGVTLILDDNITLQGLEYSFATPMGAPTKYGPLVSVSSGGTLIMNDGSTITGNTNNTGNGGGVYVSDGGTFLMNGGTISGNSCFQPADMAAVMASDGRYNAITETPRMGGGVYVSIGGTFTKTGGTITGFASDQRNGNAARGFQGQGASQDKGHAVYAALGTRTGIFANETGSKRKERTAGPDVNLHIGNGSFSGGWDF